MPNLFPPYEEIIRRREVETFQTIEKAHGRLERRRIELTSVIADYTDWPGAKQFAKITRYRTLNGKRSKEIEFLVTSLAREQAGPEALLQLRRAHWGVESRLFCVRDVTFHEDQCRVRKGTGPQAMAALRNTAITMLRRAGVGNIAAGLRHFMMNYRQAISLIRYGRIE